MFCISLIGLLAPRRESSTRAQRAPLQLEPLEPRCLLDAEFRSITGFGNNPLNAAAGMAGADLLRLSPADYADGISAPSLPGNPSARVLSDMLNDQTDPANASQDIQTVDANSLSDFGYVWGQFIDHDMDLTPASSNEFLSIQADPNDPSRMGNQTFARSLFNPATGTDASNPRQQINAVTSFLDLSQVYGSTDEVAAALRTLSGGRLKTSPGNELPYNNLQYFTQAQLNVLNMANDAGAAPSTSLFATGDVRGNENVELTVLQTLFVRNHNRIAGALQGEHPDWSDEQLYQEARKINIATEQIITYGAFLPDLLGPDALPAYTGYNAEVDPAIATEFSTVAFRFGHSLLSGHIERHGDNGLDIADVNANGAAIPLSQDFFDPYLLNPNRIVDPLTGHTSSDIDPILKGDADGDSQAMDLLAIRDVRNLLFANGGLTDNGQDLIARDIERARDHGIGSYNDVRAALGLPPVTSFQQITSDSHVQQQLAQAYGSVSNIDPFEGGLAEDHVPGSDMGPLFTTILVNQFTRLRSGDRFLYLNERWTSDELNVLRQADTLGRVIEANTGVTNLQTDVFLFKASINGTVFLDYAGARGRRSSGEVDLANLTVQLKDQNGNLVATTLTDRHGHYRFAQFSGLSATGKYTVALILPAWARLTSPIPAAVLISRGGARVSDLDFGIQFKW
jgi:peroxidase